MTLALNDSQRLICHSTKKPNHLIHVTFYHKHSTVVTKVKELKVNKENWNEILMRLELVFSASEVQLLYLSIELNKTQNNKVKWVLIPQRNEKILVLIVWFFGSYWVFFYTLIFGVLLDVFLKSDFFCSNCGFFLYVVIF